MPEYSLLACPQELVARMSAVLCETRSEPLTSFVADTVARMPRANSFGFVQSGNDQQQRWRTLMADFTGENWSSLAQDLSGFPQYHLVVLNDKVAQASYFALSEQNSVSLGWGTYVKNPQANRALGIEVNHPIYDMETEQIGAALFQQVGAQYFFMAGTDRYANGKSENAASDTARNHHSPFQIAHEIAATEGDTLSIHGFSQGEYTSEINASGVVLSLGTAQVTTSLIFDLSQALQKQGIVTSIYDGGSAYRQLSGGVNPQGQYSNKTNGPGHFVQVEIEKQYRVTSDAKKLVTGLAAGLDAYFSE